MRRPLELKSEEASMRTIVSLTSAFESLSSMSMAQTKSKVLISNQFFEEVWNIYKQIRIDVMFNFGRKPSEKPVDRELLVLITAPNGLTGDIDQRLIKRVRERYKEEKNDILVIGHHGAQQLDQGKVPYKFYFDLPKKDFVNVDPLMEIIKKYRWSRIFYQDYVSMSEQQIKEVDLSEVVDSMGKVVDLDAIGKDAISERTYIFEPDVYGVVMHLETSILRLTLTQFIYDSKLAQVASRFKAMTAAKTRSLETVVNIHTDFLKAKRALVDTRLKESLAGLKKIRAGDDN
jgi:ATP synthase F1 gamma subunit